MSSVSTPGRPRESVGPPTPELTRYSPRPRTATPRAKDARRPSAQPRPGAEGRYKGHRTRLPARPPHSTTPLPCPPVVRPRGQSSAVARSCWGPRHDVTQDEQRGGRGGRLSAHGLSAGPSTSQPRNASHSSCSRAASPKPGPAQHRRRRRRRPCPESGAAASPEAARSSSREAVSQRARAPPPSRPGSLDARGRGSGKEGGGCEAKMKLTGQDREGAG